MGAEICKLFNAFCKEYGRELKLVFEPGKYIVAEAGYLLTQVCCIKKNRERIIVGCDSGFPQLIRPVLYGAYHHITNLSNPDGPMKVYDICGNICETGDRFAEQRKVQEIHEGDILMIANAGAYCYSMGGVYNMRPMPAEVLVQEGFAELARKRLSPQELVDLMKWMLSMDPNKRPTCNEILKTNIISTGLQSLKDKLIKLQRLLGTQ